VTPEEIVRAELDAWGRLDVDDIMSYFTRDAVWDNVPIGPASGYDEIRSAVERWLSPTTSFDAEIVNLAVAGNVVLTERIDHVFFNGQMAHARVMGTFETVGDKITAWRDYFDMSRAHA
jgi:limonene-1,2-epoxide hydrolase